MGDRRTRLKPPTPGSEEAARVKLQATARRIESTLQEVARFKTLEERGKTGARASNVVALVVAVASLVVAVVGTNMNAQTIAQGERELEGLQESLREAEVVSAYQVGQSLCGDPETDTIQSSIAMTWLTNVGRLPITVMHVGDGSEFDDPDDADGDGIPNIVVDDFAYVRTESEIGARTGPFLLDVGQAVAVKFGAVETNEMPSSVRLNLSDGSVVQTTAVDGDPEAILNSPEILTLVETFVECPKGVELARATGPNGEDLGYVDYWATIEGRDGTP